MTTIALAGLLGAGKSSVVNYLSLLAPSLDCFVEPEEDTYPEFISKGELDPFGVHSWFRATRVHNLWSAHLVSTSGEIAVVDSYYDRMLHSYVAQPEFSWILGGTDRYGEVLSRLSRMDREFLPKVDHIVFLHLEEDEWHGRLASRARSKDAELLGLFGMQRLMLGACEDIARLDGSELTVIETTGRDVRDVALEVHNIALNQASKRGNDL